MSSDLSILAEKDLLLEVAGGDQKAFGKIYGIYHPLISKVVLKFVKSPDLTNDLTQEIFIKIWDIRKELVHINSFKAYLIITASNHVLNFLKRASREAIAKGEILKHYRQYEESIEDKLASQEYLQFIDNVLNSLPPQTREVFRICREENKSYDEVASVLGITRNTVKKHIVRANKEFRDALEKNSDIHLKLLILLFLERFG
jgi:RNA polymerase sigma-70 factor (ECF subfamily)